MAFFSKLKAVFGFGDIESDEELNEKFLPYEAQHRTPYVNPFKKEENTTQFMEEEKETPQIEEQEAMQQALPQPSSDQEIDELPQEMYNGVLSIINSTIPTFIRECLDVEAEKRAITKALSPHIKRAMQSTRQKIEAEARQQWEVQRAEMIAKVEKAESMSNEANERANQAATKAQSADAQRKAVVERCRKLETRVAELEAEREQIDLENKSLLNKVKVAQVYADDAEHYREEIETLQKQIEELKQNAASAAAAEVEAKWSVEMAQLQQQITAKGAEIDTLKKQNDETTAKLDKANQELEEALVTLEIANEVQEQVDKLSEQIKARDAKIASLREQSEQKEAEAAKNYNEINNANLDLKLQYDLLKGEVDKLRQAVTTAEKEKEDSVAEIHDLLEKSEKANEEMRKRIDTMKAETETALKQAAEGSTSRDQRIDELTQQLATAASLIEQRDSSISQLNGKISALEGQVSFSKVSDSENRLKIKRLTAELEEEKTRSKQLADQLEEAAKVTAEESAPVAPKKKGRSKRAAAAAIDPEPGAAAPVSPEPGAAPEPELEEAVKQVFKIDLSDTRIDTPAEPLAAEEPVQYAQQEIVAEIQQDGLPIEVTVEPVVEPADNAANVVDELNDEGNIDDTFAKSGNDISALDDDIEWLMPAATPVPHEEVDLAAKEEVTVEKEQPAPKEEPRQQQMSLF